MKYVTYICAAALLCLGIHLAEAQQKGLSTRPAEMDNTLCAESMQFTSGRTGWKLQIPGNRPLATVAYEDGLIFVGGGFGSYEFYAIDEVYNQLRLNDINHTNLKICATHLGYNVGPDGKTHHCIDYIGLLKNLFGFKLVMPGDPSQTDHVVRYVLNQKGNYVIGLCRTKMPIIKTQDNRNFFDENYVFEYGTCDLVREGKDCTILTFGAMLPLAIIACEKLFAMEIPARTYNVTSPFHIDNRILHEAANTKLVVTHEDHIVTSGLGSIVAQNIAGEKLNVNLITVGINQYGASDNSDVLYEKYGLNVDSPGKVISENL